METRYHKPMTLTALPPELLLTIADHLLPADRGCLALCSRKLLDVLFSSRDQLKECFRVILPDPLYVDINDTRINFLAQLSRDVPQYYLCYGCLKLHTWRDIKCLRQGKESKRAKFKAQELDPPHPQLLLDFPGPPTYKLDFAHVQLAMRAFYLKPEFGIPLSSFELLIVQSSRLRRSPLKRKTSVLSIDARICPTPPTICVRTQKLVVVKFHDVFKFFVRQLSMPVCRHTATSPLEHVSLDRPLLKYGAAASKDTDANYQSCEICHALFLLEWYLLQNGDICFVLTVWIDLGSGLSPSLTRWNIDDGSVPKGRDATSQAYDPVPDPRSRFEKDCLVPESGSSSQSSAALSEEELRNRNFALLGVSVYHESKHSELAKQIRRWSKVVGVTVLLVAVSPLCLLAFVCAGIHDILKV